jgi:WD40 repeat protein
MFDVATGEPVRTYPCNTGAVFCLRFSPDGKSFATTGADGKANIWSVLPPEPK